MAMLKPATEVTTIEEVATMDQEKEVKTSPELKAAFNDKLYEGDDKVDEKTTFGKGGARRQKGRNARRKKTAQYKGRLKERAQSAENSLNKRKEEAEKNNGVKKDKNTGKKTPLTGVTRHAKLSSKAGKYKTPDEKMEEKKTELQKVADMWKQRAEEATKELEDFMNGDSRFDEVMLKKLQATVNELNEKAVNAQKAVDEVKRS